MNEPSGVELIVTLIEAIVADNRADNLGDDCAVPYWLLNGLIASWRERGEALKARDECMSERTGEPSPTANRETRT